MINHYVKLPLYSDDKYNYAVNLQGQSYVLDFQYNSRMKLYLLSLYTAENLPLVESVALVPSYPVISDYALNLLTGYFWLEEKANIISEPYKAYPEDINQYYNFYYRYSTED